MFDPPETEADSDGLPEISGIFAAGTAGVVIPSTVLLTLSW